MGVVYMPKGSAQARVDHILSHGGKCTVTDLNYDAVLGYLVERARIDGQNPPICVTLEPKNAACAFASAERGDGQMASVDGDLETMIAGLACGVPSDIGWPILAKHVQGGFCWMEDGLAGNGMRLLAKHGIEAGECGGAGIGLVQRLMSKECTTADTLRRRLGLDASSRVLVFNTEGATDPDNYAVQLKLPDVIPTPADFRFAPPLRGGQSSINLQAKL